MAINFTRLATRLGKLVGGLNDINTFQSGTLATRFDTVDNQYEAADQFIVDRLYEQLRAAQDGLTSPNFYWSSLAELTIRQEVEEDRPGYGQSLQSALNEWLRQLLVAGTTFKQSIVNLSNTPSLSDGNGKLAALAPGSLVYPEITLAQVTLDESRGAAKWQEQVTLSATGSVDNLSWLWPKGSGASVTLTAIDPALDIGITNGSFLNWVATDTTPTGWTLTSGNNPARITTAGTGVRGDDGPYAEFTGAAGTHRLDNTSVTLVPFAYYAVSVQLKRNGSVTAGGYVTVECGGQNIVTVDPSSLSTSWSQYAAVIRAPEITTTAPAIRIEHAGITAGDKFDVAHIAMVQLTPLTPAGLYVAVFSGNAAFTVNDYWTLTTNLAAGTMTGSLVRGIDRLVDLRDAGIELPTTSGTADYGDALVS